MTLSLADVALLVPLCTFTVYDISTRTLPLWLTLPALAGSIVGAMIGLWDWDFISALVAFLVLLLAGLPAGDRKAVAVVAGFLPLMGALCALALMLMAGTAILYIGRRYDLTTATWPFFPWIAGSVLAVRMIGG